MCTPSRSTHRCGAGAMVREGPLPHAGLQPSLQPSLKNSSRPEKYHFDATSVKKWSRETPEFEGSNPSKSILCTIPTCLQYIPPREVLNGSAGPTKRLRNLRNIPTEKHFIKSNLKGCHLTPPAKMSSQTLHPEPSTPDHTWRPPRGGGDGSEGAQRGQPQRHVTRLVRAPFQHLQGGGGTS